MSKHHLQTVLENIDANVRSYSGRGMYGKSCLGVTIDENEYALIADILDYVVSNPSDTFDASDVANALRRMKTDSLGRGTIVYFPTIPFTGDEEELEEDEE